MSSPVDAHRRTCRGVDPLDVRPGVVLGHVLLAETTCVLRTGTSGRGRRAVDRRVRRRWPTGATNVRLVRARGRGGDAAEHGAGSTRVLAGWGIDAFASPIWPHAMNPPLTTTVGSHAVKEARFPQHEVRPACPPADRADLVVEVRGADGGADRCTSATYRRAPLVVRPRRSPGREPRRSFITWAVLPRCAGITSPTRPIACESEPIMEDGSHVRGGCLRRRWCSAYDATLGEREVFGDVRVEVVGTPSTYVEVLGPRLFTGVAGAWGFGQTEGSTFGNDADRDDVRGRVGRRPQPSVWVRVDRAVADGGERAVDVAPPR